MNFDIYLFYASHSFKKHFTWFTLFIQPPVWLGNLQRRVSSFAQGHTMCDWVKILIPVVWLQSPAFPTKRREPSSGPAQHRTLLALVQFFHSRHCVFQLMDELAQIESDFHKVTELASFVGGIYLPACSWQGVWLSLWPLLLGCCV